MTLTLSSPDDDVGLHCWVILLHWNYYADYFKPYLFGWMMTLVP